MNRYGCANERNLFLSENQFKSGSLVSVGTAASFSLNWIQSIDAKKAAGNRIYFRTNLTLS